MKQTNQQSPKDIKMVEHKERQSCMYLHHSQAWHSWNECEYARIGVKWSTGEHGRAQTSHH